MGSIQDKIALKLEHLDRRDRFNASSSAKTSITAGATTTSLMRIRDAFGKGKGKARYTLTTPNRSNTREMQVEGKVSPCPRGCGPMTQVELHASRRGLTCTTCRVTEPLDEMHIEES